MTELSIADTGAFPAPPARFNMAAHTFAAGAPHPDKTALEVIGAPGEILESWTYAALTDAVLRTAGGLRAHAINPGDRILLRIGNSSDFPIAFFAAIAIGAVPVPSSTQLTPAEIAVILDDLAPAAICLGDGLSLPDTAARVLTTADLRALRSARPAPFADTAADDPAFMIYTSGTGGRPKGVVHAQRAAWARRMMWDGWYGLTPADRVLHAGAFNWTYTLGAGLTDPWAIGATALIHTGTPAPAIWPALAHAHRATIFAAVPGIFRQVLARAPDVARGFAGLRHALTAGEALPDTLADTWTATTGTPIFEALGMSEISTYISFSPSAPRLAGHAGRPQPGRRVAILHDETYAPVPLGQEGLLAVFRRDPGLMLGYWRRPEETEAAFRGEWFLTGDRAVMAPSTAIRYLGRADDVMNAGGYRVNPQEVEAALTAHPGVHEAAARAVEVRAGVWVIAAFYVPEAGPVPEAELAAHCAGCLARYKTPRLFRAVDSLPRNANGKLMRRSLTL